MRVAKCQTCERMFTEFEVKHATCVVIGCLPNTPHTVCVMCRKDAILLEPVSEEYFQVFRNPFEDKDDSTN